MSKKVVKKCPACGGPAKNEWKPGRRYPWVAEKPRCNTTHHFACACREAQFENLWGLAEKMYSAVRCHYREECDARKNSVVCHPCHYKMEFDAFKKEVGR